MINIITIIKNGYEVDLSELGLICTHITVDSLSSEHELATVEGLDGIAHIDTQYGGRSVHTSFYINAIDYDDFADKRDSVYKLFRAKDVITLIDNSQPHKQWKVQLAEGFTIDNELSPNNDVFDITFISKSPYASSESIVTTAKESQFYVLNDGDIALNARYHPITITFKGVSDKLRIVNNYNGSQWQYKGTTELLDEIKIKMIYPYKNGQNIFKDTDYGAIELNEGNNEFQIYGASGDYEIKFEYAPLYI